MLVRAISVGIYLLAAAIFDLKFRGIPTRLIYLFLAEAAAVFVLSDNSLRIQCVMGAGMGALFLLMGKLTDESIGYGDGWSVLLIGLLLGFRAVVFCITAAMLFSAAYAFFLLIRKKAAANTRFPFIPVLCAAFCLWAWIN